VGSRYWIAGRFVEQILRAFSGLSEYALFGRYGFRFEEDLTALQGGVDSAGNLNHLFDLPVPLPLVLEIVVARNRFEAHEGEAFNDRCPIHDHLSPRPMRQWSVPASSASIQALSSTSRLSEAFLVSPNCAPFISSGDWVLAHHPLIVVVDSTIVLHRSLLFYSRCLALDAARGASPPVCAATA
jgi:hypothetical protein